MRPLPPAPYTSNPLLPPPLQRKTLVQLSVNALPERLDAIRTALEEVQVTQVRGKCGWWWLVCVGSREARCHASAHSTGGSADHTGVGMGVCRPRRCGRGGVGVCTLLGDTFSVSMLCRFDPQNSSVP